MTVQVHAHPDGSYQWVEGTFTEADVESARQSGDPAAWIRDHAELVQGQ